MATISRENIGLLNDKVTVTVAKTDYLPAFEQSLKKYAKTANIPGFRKGMVPAGLVKKMYGQSVFTDEILRTVEKELNNYMSTEQLEIFAQPLPLETDSRMLDINNPQDYAFAFEIGLKPQIKIDVANCHITRYKVQATDTMINEEVSRLQTRHGKMTEPETITSEDHVLNILFTEIDEAGNHLDAGISKANSLLVKYFAEPVRSELTGKKKDDSIQIQLKSAFEQKERDWVMDDLGLDKTSESDQSRNFRATITKVGWVEKADMTPEFFEAAFPGRNISSEEELRNAVKVDIENQFEQQSRNQVHDQIYHFLIDHTPIELPETFLKKWLQTGGETPKSAEEAEKEYPSFASQLKWTLISTQLINEHKINVESEEIRQHAMQQVLGYMGIQNLDDAPWADEYANRMMQDKKFVENTYFQLQTGKLFQLLEGQVTQQEESISAEDFAQKLHHHHH